MRHVAQAGSVFLRVVSLLVTVLLLSAIVTQKTAAHSGWSKSHFSPTQGDVNAGDNLSGSLPGYREIHSWMIWQTASTCTTSSALYTFCSGQHDVFEHNVELSNYQSVYPYEYRYAKWPEAYSSNFPGRKYLDTQASDSGLESFTVGTLDAEQFQPYVWYYGNIIGSPDYPGPNWYQLRFEVGDSDDQGWMCGVIVSYEWCMLSPDHGNARIPLTNHYTFPNHLYWWGQ